MPRTLPDRTVALLALTGQFLSIGGAALLGLRHMLQGAEGRSTLLEGVAFIACLAAGVAISWFAGRRLR